MATGTIPLPIGAAIPPDGSTNNLAPGLSVVKSSASAPTPFYLVAAFDGTNDEQLVWSVVCPADYASSPVLKLLCYTTVTTGTFRFEGRVAATSSGDAQDIRAKAFAATNSNGTTAPTTAGYLKLLSITLTNDDSMAAGDDLMILLRRDADGTTGTDDITADVLVKAAWIEYTKA